MSAIKAEFAASASALKDCPRWTRREVAIAGRSNVGKSSLLNALTGVRGLARTSRTPGRTQAINFFAAGDSMALVDLPGYGYAKIPQALAEKIARAMDEYLAGRKNLHALVLLVDCRRGPEEEEVRLAGLARERGLVLIVAATAGVFRLLVVVVNEAELPGVASRNPGEIVEGVVVAVEIAVRPETGDAGAAAK